MNAAVDLLSRLRSRYRSLADSVRERGWSGLSPSSRLAFLCLRMLRSANRFLCRIGIAFADVCALWYVFVHHWGAKTDPTRASGSRLIVMPVLSDLRVDPRVERAARTAVQAGFEVKVVYPDFLSMPGAPVALDWGPSVRFAPLPQAAAFYSAGHIGLYGPKILKALRSEACGQIHAHDLNVTLMALLAAQEMGAKTVVDFHEWWSENVHWDRRRGKYVPHSPFQKRVFKAAERLALTHADEVVTVCDSIAESMPEELGCEREVSVVRNIPLVDLAPTIDYIPLKEQLGIPEDRFLIVWQGGTGPTRLIEPIIEALAHATDCTLLVRGPSLELFGEGYGALAARIGVSDRLILAAPVPSRDVVAAARGADAGVWSLPNLCRNFTYALPNKIFEYLGSGLPVLVADYPEARRLVEAYGIGLTFDPYDPRSIGSAMNRMASDRALYSKLKSALPLALASMNVEDEWSKLAAIYRRLHGDRAGSCASPWRE